jgi:hypothetical protein
MIFPIRSAFLTGIFFRKTVVGKSGKFRAQNHSLLFLNVSVKSRRPIANQKSKNEHAFKMKAIKTNKCLGILDDFSGIFF